MRWKVLNKGFSCFFVIFLLFVWYDTFPSEINAQFSYFYRMNISNVHIKRSNDHINVCKVDAHQSFAWDLRFNHLMLYHSFSHKIEYRIHGLLPTHSAMAHCRSFCPSKNRTYQKIMHRKSYDQNKWLLQTD